MRWLAALISAATISYILASRLVFAPVPWPDGSAFYLPGLELIHWPSQWRMHTQAAFIPSYDEANFNLMPALPIILGLAARSGALHFVNPELLIRAISLIALVGWAWLLWEWLLEALAPLTSKRYACFAASIIGLAALWDPVVRWGTLVVRTETWIGFCWIWILREMDRWERAEHQSNAPWSRIAWRIAAGLALSAYFHFEAVYFVPAVIIGMGFRTGWFKRLVTIGLRTTLLLSPWLLYVMLHLRLFFDQMTLQFFRLAHGNHWMSNLYLIFHSLFVDHGSPAGWPKFFNLAKGIFWLLLFGLGVLALRFRARQTRALAASVVAFAFAFYLWATKAEIWFITLCHLVFWPGVAAAVIGLIRLNGPVNFKWLQRGITGLVAASALISLAAAFAQQRDISPAYSWDVYMNWVSCMEHSLGELADKPALRFWQPHVPDVLVELSRRHPGWEGTRALDFTDKTEFALRAARGMDAIFFTNYFNPGSELVVQNYEGPLREADRIRMSNGIDLPYGPWGLVTVPGEEPGKWKTTVCEVGPFWAAVVMRHP